MVNYGFGMPTRLVADGDVARWCGRLVAHYGGTKALVVLGGDKHTCDELVAVALGSLDRGHCWSARCSVVARLRARGETSWSMRLLPWPPTRASTLCLRLGMPTRLDLRARLPVVWRCSILARTVLFPMAALSRRERCLRLWVEAKCPSLPLSRLSSWMALALPCASCSPVCAPPHSFDR